MSATPTPRPIETTIPIRGLSKPFTILQITDLHACALSPVDEATMPAARLSYARERVAAFAGGRPYPSAALLPVLMDYATEIAADLVLLTGDILDFPSEGNLALLGEALAASRVPALYIPGNHDWSFADDYHTATARAAYLPYMDTFAGGDHSIAVYETDTLAVCALDNGLDRIPEATANAYMNLAARLGREGKPLILAMHIPLQVDSLTPDTIRVWGRDLTIGERATGGWDAQTVRFCREVTEGRAFAPAAVITGHLHLSHEDVFPNGVPQLVTDIACDGICRVVHLTPQTD